MNIQVELEQFKHKTEEIIEDMKTCISYTPDKENDLLCLMERYLKASKEHRKSLLDQIKKCMSGEVYENPFLVYYGYSQEDIERFDYLLKRFIDHLKIHHQSGLEVRFSVRFIVIELNKLNDKCQGRLIDPFRREMLISFFEGIAKIIGCEGIKNSINEYRSW